MITVNGSDITGSVTAAEISEKVNSGAGILRFSVLGSEVHKLKNGDRVVLSKNGIIMFCGKVFSRNIRCNIAEIAAFDSIAGLSTILPIKRNAVKASDFVKEVFAAAAPCAETGAVDVCDVELLPEQYKNISLLNILYRVIGEVEIKGAKFVLRDEAGAVSFRNSATLNNSFILNENGIIAFDYRHSLEDCFNYVKLISNDPNTGLNETAVAQNETLIAKLGVRGIVKKVNGKNPQQLVDMASELLKQKSIEKEILDVSALGDARVRAGCRILCSIKGLGDFMATVIASRHSFAGKSHLMQLELEICR